MHTIKTGRQRGMPQVYPSEYTYIFIHTRTHFGLEFYFTDD